MSPFFTNYGRKPQFDIEQGNLLPTEAVLTTTQLSSLHHQLTSDITFLNTRMAISTNKKRSEGPNLRKGDKVYLWRRNIRTKRSSNKLDFLKLGAFEIEDKKGPVNYKLKLPKGIRIHPVFHISLLKPAHPDAPLDQSTELDGDRLEPEYKVESILNHAVHRRQHKYLVKWKGYPTEENT
jgi:hypothetical protein